MEEDWEKLVIYTRRVHRIGSVELVDALVQRVYIQDMPGMRIAFEVGLELDLIVREGDYHYDEADECFPWIRILCEGDLACGLNDWQINRIEPYSKKNAPLNSMSDELVPIIPNNRMEQVAKEFLQQYYPDALKITPTGTPPVYVDPQTLADNLGLTVLPHSIREDGEVFGQIYFEDTDAELYDSEANGTASVPLKAGTIVVDPDHFLLYNLGSVNNTIVHECVHWVKHRKCYELERLYNSEAVGISCEVTGEAESELARTATERMEYQANRLTPRIQMPAAPFKAKADEYIVKFMRETGARNSIEVMESVIVALARDFVVSRQAAKLRLYELGFHEALGTFTYIDDHWVKPHSFRKGAITEKQTFTISATDAVIRRNFDPELKKLAENGDYLFLDNHFVYNAPLYVQPDQNGMYDLTGYARAHMDECCLVFDLKITSKVAEDLHTACYLNREPSNYSFKLEFHNGSENAPQERQTAIRKKEMDEAMAIRMKMTDDRKQCMELLLEWRQTNNAELGRLIGRNEKTIRRISSGESNPEVETAAAICLGLNLPPAISMKLMSVLGFQDIAKSVIVKHQYINEALCLVYMGEPYAAQKYLEPYGINLGIPKPDDFHEI